MGLLSPQPKGDKDSDLRKIAILTTVPAMMLAAPLIGYGIGWWLDTKFGTDPYLSLVGILLGLGSAGVETYRLIKKASSDDTTDKDNAGF